MHTEKPVEMCIHGMETSRQLYLLAPRDQQTSDLASHLRQHGISPLPLNPRSAQISAHAIGVFDLRLLLSPSNLSRPAQCVLAHGRWLLINAAKPFAEDYLLFNPGVYGLLHCEETSAALLPALDCVARGELWLPRAFLAQVFERQRIGERATASTWPDLTRRDWQVIRGLLAAENNRQISQRLNVQESTVKRHLYNLFRKLGVCNRLEALRWAHAAGLQHEPNARPGQPPATHRREPLFCL